MLKLRPLLLLFIATLASAQDAPAPLSATTDPARAQVVLPEPANAKLPSLILIGDSTVRNGHDDGQGKGAAGQWGWGNPLAAAFDASRINVVNRAVGGLSSRTYLTSGHWEKTRAFIKRGDTVLIQFGHNDASAINDASRARGTIKGTGPEREEIDNLLTGRKETVYSYGAYLRRYVSEIRALGATPVLCSLVPRKRWDEQGRVQRSGAKGYAAWAAEVAAQEGIAFIDLNELVAQRYEALGRDAVMKLFPEVTPDESVHTNWAGAALTAQVVVASLKRLKVLPDAVYADERPVVDAGKATAAPLDARLPTLFIVGDSTVRSNGQGGAYGWGERLAPYFDAQRINLVNHAIGGRSSRTFLSEGRWDAVMAQLKAGDFVLIQFGHNDGGRIGDPAMKGRASGPGTGPELVDDIKPDGTREQVRTFGAYMARYVADAKARGASVVILSPIPHKDRWKDGQRDFENFAAWGAQVAREGGAAFIDLTMLITEGYRQLGDEPVNAFFSDARTHTNDAGARYNAARVVDGLKALPGQPFAPYLAAAPLVFEKGRLLFADDFQDASNWQAEIAPLPGSSVSAQGGKLVLDTAGGVTAWFKPRLSGNVLIEYRRKVLMQGGPRDRLSDLNQFWMAEAPIGKLDGVFESYDGLALYYAGIGGNGNTSTRFRRYEGNGQRTLLKEYADAAHLLQPNRELLVQTLVKDGRTAVFVDGQPWFDFQDPRPLSSGHFGLRSTQSRQEISAFRVYAVK